MSVVDRAPCSSWCLCRAYKLPEDVDGLNSNLVHIFIIIVLSYNYYIIMNLCLLSFGELPCNAYVI